MPSRTRIPSNQDAHQDARLAHTDADPDQKDLGSAASGDQQADATRDSMQTGGTRSPKRVRSSGHPHNVAPATAAYEGSVKSRVFDDPTKQGISSRSSQAELPGQQKVTSARADALAGLDHSSRNEERHD